MISGRSRLTTYENTENLKPGKISSVTAAPPTSGRRSSTSVLASRAREVRRGDEAVVAAADDDRVVALRRSCASSVSRIEEREACARRASARLRRCSTVISSSTGCPAAKCGARRCASASVLLEQRRPAAARGVADLVAVAVDRRARAPRDGRELRRQAALARSSRSNDSQSTSSPTKPHAGPRARSRAQRAPPVERALRRRSPSSRG